MKRMCALVILVVGIFAASSAFAISQSYMALQFNDNAGNIVTYTSADAPVGLYQPGSLTFVGGVGNWSVNVSTLLSYPKIGSQAVPMLDLNSVNLLTGAAGHLTIMACVLNFDASPGASFGVHVGGTNSGTAAQFSAFSSNSNLFFTNMNQVFASPMFNTASFSGDFFGVIPAGAISYTIAADIYSTGRTGGSTSFDMSFNVPEPTSLMLLGLGLLGIAGIRRKH